MGPSEILRSAAAKTYRFGMVTGSIEVEVTAPRNEITNRSLIVLLFDDKGPFSLTQLQYMALQVATMCSLRSDKVDHKDLR